MNETKETKKMSKYQTLKMKVRAKMMHVLTIGAIFGTMIVSDAAALNNSSFQGVTDTIEAVIPIFSALQDLVVAVVPYIITLAVVGGLIVLIKNLFSKGLNWK